MKIRRTTVHLPPNIGSQPPLQVEIEWQGRKLGVPLAQLTGVGATDDTAEAIADWHYWVAQGRQF